MSGESEKFVAIDLVGESLQSFVFAFGFGRAGGGDGDRRTFLAGCFVVRNVWDGASYGGRGGGDSDGKIACMLVTAT